MQNNVQQNKEMMKVPEKFLDANTGEVKLEMLVKSYIELEKRLSQRHVEDDNLLEKGLRPEGPESYDIKINEEIFDIDQELNKAFFEKGFTNDQVQFVYDLAEEKMIPMIAELAQEFEAEKEVAKLIEHFGGEEKYREVSRQILAWAKNNMKQDILESMSFSYDGVLALYQMMQNSEPKTIKEKGIAGITSENDLQALIKDPRYWGEKDPAFIEKVTAAFKSFYSK